MTDMTEQDARSIVYALGTAMLNEDKPSREMIYEDLTNEELKKVLRWAMRQNLYNFAIIAAMNGMDIMEAWSTIAMNNAQGFDEE
jgi:hypothetical protein